MKLNFTVFILLLTITISIKSQQDTGLLEKNLSRDVLTKTLEDQSNFTTVGNIGLSVTNFGMYGSGWVNWPDVPSCEYPIGSGIEHLFAGGLWVGGFTKSSLISTNKLGPFVSTAAIDASTISSNRGGGFEYTNAAEDQIIERSSLLDSRFYDPEAISHQDFVMDFSDTNTRVL